MPGYWLIRSQFAELMDITRLPLPEKQSKSDQVYKQMIYFRKEKKKPVASPVLACEQRVAAASREIK